MRHSAISLAFVLTLLVGVSGAQSNVPQPSTSSNNTPSEDALVSFLTVLSQSATEQNEDNQMKVGLQFTELYDSNPLNVVNRPRADEISSLNGNFGLNKKWKHTAIAGNYTGGADYYYRLKKQDQTYHEASAAENFAFGPVTFLLGGDYELLPSPSFGFDATHQITNGSLDLINPDLLPSQNIQTAPLRQASYTGIGQLGLQLSDRSQLSFSGSYGQLRYAKNGIPGTDQTSAAGAYALALSSRDSIGLSYQYEVFETSGNPLEIVDQVVTASYAHQFGKNLTIKFGAGPDLRTFNNTRARLLQGVDSSVAANSSLDYSRRSTHLNATYTRSTTSGQGILDGSEADQIELSVSQGLGRGWTVTGAAGYARTTSLARIVRSSGSQLTDQILHSGYYSPSFSKRVGMFSFIVGYTLETQDSTAPICTASLCQYYPLHHVVTMGFSFNPKPVNLK